MGLAGFGLFLGNAAFCAGLPVKRWFILGALLGPVAYPLFNTHKHLAYKRCTKSFDASTEC
ncbi:hypothetical protein LZP73_11555 [Shewanella sp. AS16]|nr:hypothetical protein [Shewanella salipaludis]MCE9686828.1 hypothetical protein [Shewanella sp. AS16]